MFNSLSKREKTLAIVVVGLLPVLLVAWAISSFSTRYFAKRAKIRSLTSEIQDRNDELDRVSWAQQRRWFYAESSVPSNGNQAKIDYADWLINQIERAKLKYENVEWEKSSEKLKYRAGAQSIDVAEQFTCNVKASGTLDQIVSFLDYFGRLNLLHRIESFNIRKIPASNAQANNAAQEGRLIMDMNVQILRMSDAPEAREFLSAQNEFPQDNSALVNTIIARNFFGPANNDPVITTSNRSLETDSQIAFDVSADDADRDDLLKIEMLETTVPGGKLVQVDEKSRKAAFTAEGVAPGEYELKVRVTDNGLPQKSVEKKISVAVKEKKIEPPKVEPPAFRHAQGTYITGYKGDVLWVNMKSKNELKYVKVGETFELDGAVWKVISIESRRKIVIQRGDELLTFKLGSTLDEPLEKNSINVPVVDNQ